MASKLLVSRVKGREIQYESLKTQPYLCPEAELSVDNMRKIYHLRNQEIFIKANFPSAFDDKLCLFPGCFETDDQYHIFNSSCFSEGDEITQRKFKYEYIFGKDVNEQQTIDRLKLSLSDH